MSYRVRIQMPEDFFAWDHYSMKNRSKSSSFQSGMEGFFDMAKVDGKTSHDWGTHLEPLFPDKYRLKDVKLMFITPDLDATISAFESDNGFFLRSSENLIIDQYDGSQNILYNGPYKLVSGINFQRINKEGAGLVDVSVQIEEQFIEGSLVSGTSGYRLNLWPIYENFGMSITRVRGFRDTGVPLKLDSLDFYDTSGAGFPEIEVVGVISASDLNDLNTKLGMLRHQLRGECTFTIPDSGTYDVFCTDGFTVPRIACDYNSYVFAEIKLSLKKIVQ